jgi:serine/threonine-protein kinase
MDFGRVLEPLSEPIRKLLLELRLCSECDLRRCRRHVRRLTCDLPAFDSIWLDALVQIGRLTPYQARVLESSNPRSLEIGPCVGIDRLGGGMRGETLLARAADTHELRVAKILSSSDLLTAETIDRLEQLVNGTRELVHPSIIVPLACIRHENRVVLVSRYASGPHLAELLVRRGRFPAAVVWEVGRQLMEGLAALDRCGVAHGDIRAANVRLTAAGTAVLVDSGIRSAIGSVLALHAGIAPDRYDGIAPELIGGAEAPNSLSDEYALGCLLWQLLSGRAPFPGGDPLVKLAAHQTRAIGDVRSWAPDTPPALAEGIRRLTARDPGERPATYAEVLDVWTVPGRLGRRRLVKFRRQFDAPARNPRPRKRLSTPTRWLLSLALLFVASGGIVTLADQGARNVVLAWAAHIAETLPGDGEVREEIKSRHSNSAGDGTKSQVAELQPRGRSLPAPDSQGVIHLDGREPWQASDHSVVGPLTISGDKDEPPQIVISDRPLKLWAESVTLKNVRIVVDPGTALRPPKLNALLLVQSQGLSIDGCLFNTGGVPESAESDSSLSVTAPATGPAAIAWKLLDPQEQRGGTARVERTVLLGSGPALYLAHPMRRVEFDNVLKLGTGPLVQLAAVPRSKSRILLRLNHATCRASGALLRWIVPVDRQPAGQILIEADDCVFDILSPRAALFEFAGPTPHPEWQQFVKMTGEGSTSPPALEVAAWISTGDGRVTPFDPPTIELEGIVAGPFRYAGEATPRASDSAVRDSEAPRRTNDQPGIRADELPVAP